jgi:hypothetical protein
VIFAEKLSVFPTKGRSGTVYWFIAKSQRFLRTNGLLQGRLHIHGRHIQFLFQKLLIFFRGDELLLRYLTGSILFVLLRRLLYHFDIVLVCTFVFLVDLVSCWGKILNILKFILNEDFVGFWVAFLEIIKLLYFLRHCWRLI